MPIETTIAEKTLTIDLPAQREVLVKAVRKGLPEVLMVNEALLDFAHSEVFAWHLSVVLEATDLIDNGMPSPIDSDILFRIGDEIEALVLGTLADNDAVNALFLARSTWNGIRELGFYVHDPEFVHDALQALLASRTWERQWRYRMRSDPGWEEAGFVFQLFAPPPEGRS
jgi:hypothetical protein